MGRFGCEDESQERCDFGQDNPMLDKEEEWSD
jgi:hypothetical protein